MIRDRCMSWWRLADESAVWCCWHGARPHARPGTGASYLGHTQWAVAPYVDPPLESVCLNITAAKISGAFYQRGVPSLQNALNWTGLIGRQERGPLSALPNPRQMERVRRALRKIP